MHNDFWNHAGKEELVESHGETKASPIMSVFENLQAVAIELDVTIEVHLEKGPHWDLVATRVFRLVRFFLEGKVVLDWTSWISGLFILTRGQSGCEVPEGNEDRDSGEQGEEYSGLEPSANLP